MLCINSEHIAGEYGTVQDYNTDNIYMSVDAYLRYTLLSVRARLSTDTGLCYHSRHCLLAKFIISPDCTDRYENTLADATQNVIDVCFVPSVIGQLMALSFHTAIQANPVFVGCT